MDRNNSTYKIYFAGSIRGGRTDAGLYQEIICYLKTRGEVLTEHVGNDDLTTNGESNLPDEEIYNRDLNWLMMSDIIIAEVTTPSLGVGFEIAKAIDMKKKVICLYRVRPDQKLSAMISGCPEVSILEYRNMEDIKLLADTIVFNEKL